MVQINKGYKKIMIPNLYCLILDRSGSMQSIWNEITTSVNLHLIEKCKNSATSLLLFDTGGLDYIFKYQFNPEKLNTSNFQPRGGTPLRDAIMHGVNTLIEDIGGPIWQEKSNIEFTIFTDGEENSSHKWTDDDVCRTINYLQDNYGWKFNFIGAGENKNVKNYAKKYGFKEENVISYREKEELEKVFHAV